MGETVKNSTLGLRPEGDPGSNPGDWPEPDGTADPNIDGALPPGKEAGSERYAGIPIIEIRNAVNSRTRR